jgi:antirestriction protein ArdC
VKKGEKGIMIMAPVTRRIGNIEEQRDDGTVESKDIHRVVNVKPVYVFDISQTDGEPLPEFAQVTGEPAHHVERLKAFIQSRGIVLEYADALGGAMGSSHGGRIRILSGQTEPAEFSVLAHEYAHEALHRGERRIETSKTIRETEAEAVAYVVCNAIDLETSTASSDYIQLYRGDKDTLAESLQHVRNVSAEILEALQPAE